MIGVVLKGLAGRKIRAILTALAIVLGVAMISGTYVLTDTITKGFDTIFTGSYKNSDAIVSAKSAVSSNQAPSDVPGFPQDVLAKVRALPDVGATAGSVGGQAVLVDKQGKVIGSHGAPSLAFSVDPREPQFNPLTLVAGRWPHGPEEIAIDKATADEKHFRVGDAIRVSARAPVRTFRVAGIAKFGSVASIGGATLAIFDLPTAQDVLGKRGKLDEIRVAGNGAVSTPRLLDEIRPVLPPTAQVRNAGAQAKEDAKATNGFLSIIQKFLLAFAAIALFVGAFVIFNTLSITVAQRTREFATLRTLGGTRSQVLRSVLLEGFVIGLLASLIGLFLGLALAKGLNALFEALGIDLPKSGTVFATRTIVVALVVGTLMTVIASLAPAIRATRVAPIAAVREGAVLPRSRFSRFTPYIGLVASAVAVAMLSFGVFANHVKTTPRLVDLGFGCLLLFLGVALFSSKLVRPLASVLGFVPARFFGAPGSLARENTMRNPGRTAVTAAALMIGLALVTFVAVLGKGLRASFETSVDKQFVGDYALTSQSGFQPIPPASAEALRRVPGVEAVSSVRAGAGRAFRKTVFVTAVDPNVGKTIVINWIGRSTAATPRELGRDGAFVNKDYASKHHLRLGSPIALQTPTGDVLRLRLRGIFDPPNGGSPFGDVTISTAAFDAAYPQPNNLYTFVNTRGGITDATTRRLAAALKGFPDAKVQTEAQFKANQERGINTLLNLLFVLLALSVIVSLFGIVNTLALSVFERTRELGMLRAVGTTRWQVRLMVLYESVTTALIGTALGLVLGLFLAELVTVALRSTGLVVFAVPAGSLVAFVVVGFVVGILAAIFPAQRAARLNVLQALQYE